MVIPETSETGKSQSQEVVELRHVLYGGLLHLLCLPIPGRWA